MLFHFRTTYASLRLSGYGPFSTSMKHLLFSFTVCPGCLPLCCALSLAASAAAYALPFADNKIITVEDTEPVTVGAPLTPAEGIEGVSATNPYVIKRGDGILVVDAAGKIDFWTAPVVEEGALLITGKTWAGTNGYDRDGVIYMHTTALGYNVGGDNARLIVREGAKIYHTDFSNIGTYKGDAFVTVTGEGTYWNNGNCLFIGGNGFYHDNMAYKPAPGSSMTNGGKGDFTISDGAIVEAGAASLDNIAGRQVHIGHSGEGVLTVDGEGSQFIAHGYVSVGTFGALESKQDTWGPAEGHLLVTDKGSVLITNRDAADSASADLIAGYYAGTTGNVTVTGGSNLTVEGGDAYIGAALGPYPGYLSGTTTAGLYVDDESHVDISGDAVFALGADADTTLEVKGGSTVAVGGSTWLGAAGDSTTHAVVSGTDSRLNAGTNLYMGVGADGSADGGDATLLVDGGAHAHASGSYRSGSDSDLTIRNAGQVSVGGQATQDAFQVDGSASASIKGTVDIDATQLRHGMSATRGGGIVLQDAELLKIRAQNGKYLLYTDIASSLSGSATCDLIGEIRNEGTTDLTMTSGSVFVGNTAMPSGTFYLALEDSTWQLTATSTLSAISSKDDSTLVFTIFGQDDFLSILATVATLHDTTVKVILNGYSAVEWDSFCLVDASSYDITGITFDFSEALLAQGLEWNVDDFSTEGVIKILAATPIPEPAGLTTALAGLALAAAARRRRHGFTS